VSPYCRGSPLRHASAPAKNEKKQEECIVVSPISFLLVCSFSFFAGTANNSTASRECSREWTGGRRLASVLYTRLPYWIHFSFPLYFPFHSPMQGSSRQASCLLMGTTRIQYPDHDRPQTDDAPLWNGPGELREYIHLTLIRSTWATS
jgi:hypothetical protein